MVTTKKNEQGPERDGGGSGTSVKSRSPARGVEASASAERKQTLLKVSAELFVEQGYRATTVRQIGEAAGVLSGSLYHHFGSKEAILDELLSKYLDELVDSYLQIIADQRDPVEALRDLIRAGFASLEKHRAAATVLQNEFGNINELPRFAYLERTEATMKSIWTRVIQQAMDERQIRSDLDPRVIYRFLRDGLWVAVRWFRSDGQLSLADIAEQHITLSFDGLVTR